MCFLETDFFEALEDQPLDGVFVAADAQRLREAAQFVRGVARAQIRADLRAAGVSALERALRLRIGRSVKSVTYPSLYGSSKVGGGSGTSAGNLQTV